MKMTLLMMKHHHLLYKVFYKQGVRQLVFNLWSSPGIAYSSVLLSVIIYLCGALSCKLSTDMEIFFEHSFVFTLKTCSLIR